LDLVMEMLQRRFLLDAGPDRLHPIAAGEMSDARELQLEARRPNAGERGIDIIRVAAIDLAQESQRDVEILRRYPAGSREPAAEQAELPTDIVGQAEGYEEAHDQARSSPISRHDAGS